MTKYILAAVIAVVVAGGVYGGYKFLFAPAVSSIGTSTAGSTGTTARQYNVYGVNLAAPGANATSSSILNGSANDYYVTSVKAGCEGVGTSKTAYTGAGLANLTLTVATSSTSAPATNSNTNTMGFNIATSASQFTESSSTVAGGNNNVTYIWGAGVYMTFTVNATNTAVCTFGVDAFSS